MHTIYKPLLPLKKITIPYSDHNLKHIENISNFHSVFFQSIANYTHNNFEIDLWVGKPDQNHNTTPGLESGSASESLPTLGPEAVERLFVLHIALFNLTRAVEPGFIDFSRFRLHPLPGSASRYSPEFPLLLPSPGKKEISPAQVIKPFQKNKHFKDLNETNHTDIFHRLREKHTFNPYQVYFYRFNEFASTLLSAYPIDELKSGSNIKIKINTAHPIQEKIVKLNLYKTHIAGDIFFLDVDGYSDSDNLPDVFSRVLSETLRSETQESTGTHGAADIIGRFHRFLKKSPYRSVLILLHRLKSREDAEFLNYLLHSSGISNLVLIVFNTPPGRDLIQFDLELKETPKNLLEDHLNLHGSGKTIALDSEENQCLKILHALPFPISNDPASLAAIFSPARVRIVRDLIARNILKTAWGNLEPNTGLQGLNAVPSGDEEIKILESYRRDGAFDTPHSFNLDLKYFLKTRKTSEVNRLLEEYLRKKTGQTPGKIEELVSLNLPVLEDNPQSLRLAVEILLKEDLTDLAETVIHRNLTKDPVFLTLKQAHIFRLKKDHPQMYRLLKEIKGKIPGEFADEFYYLNYIYYEKTADVTNAHRYLEKIKSPLFIHLADIKKSDRYIYEGDMEKAEHLLEDALRYLRDNGYGIDELEAGSQLAKVYRKKQLFDEAETLYKNIFITGEMKNFRLFSANVASDLGNLYHDRDDFSRAESWYQKALKIFQALKNKNGIIRVESNLAEIYKIKGDWQKTRKSLNTFLAYDKEQGLADAEAIDLFNIAHLEYLKHNETGARKFLEKANTLFQKKNNVGAIIESELFKAKLLFLFPPQNHEQNLYIDLRPLEKYRDQLSHDWAILLTLFEIGNLPSSYNKPFNRKVLNNIDLIQSRFLRFEIIALFILSGHKGKLDVPALLRRLRVLSKQLSNETRNYYYFQYYYVYFGWLLETGESGIGHSEKDIFFDMYYFFLGNGRKLSPVMVEYKNRLDEKESENDVFRSAERVEGSVNWKIPTDFFDHLLTELRKAVPVHLAQLAIYENGEPVFHFSTETKFKEITGEIISKARYSLENLDLTHHDVKRSFKSNERAFYNFPGTKVLLWKLSDTLSGVLLLAFLEASCLEYDFSRRSPGLFKTFGTLIHNYYEKDFKVSKKLNWIIGDSPPMKELKKKIITVGKVPFSLLIRGESGTGKDLAARGVHLLSSRAGNPFVPVNAAAIPENLLEAELFGYKRGAFTGANENKTGLIETAGHGTLFLDEIADLPLNLQAKMLRVLQDNEIRRLGDTKTITVDFRLICATNKNLKALIREGRFREDLYFRIRDLTLDVPPLRERTGDIPLLVRYFLKKYKFSIENKSELQRITGYFENRPWAGNVRELESTVKRLITFYPDFEMEDEEEYDLSAAGPGLIAVRDHLEKTMVYRALKKNNWKKQKAADSLLISRQYLDTLMRKHEIVKG